MRRLFYHIILQLILSTAFGQINDIPGARITDSILLDEISYFIEQENKEDANYFKNGMGYLILRALNTHKQPGKDKNLPRTFTLNVQYIELEKLPQLPTAFTKVNSRLILIYLDHTTDFITFSGSKRKTKKLSRLIDAQLPEKKTLKYKTESGEKIKLTNFSESRVRLHGGIRIEIFEDGSVKRSPQGYH